MRRLLNLLFTALAIAALIWTIGLARFVATLPADVADDRSRTDAVVVLTGGRDRLATGLTLLRKDYASRLLISGVAEGITTDRLLDQLGMSGYPPELRPRITLGHKANSTVQNARETAEWCREEGFHSIRLVTAAYHMKRSLLEFQREMPGVRILPHPVFPEAVKQGQWWKYPGTLLLMTREYSKFLIASLAHMLGMTTEGFS